MSVSVQACKEQYTSMSASIQVCQDACKQANKQANKWTSKRKQTCKQECKQANKYKPSHNKCVKKLLHKYTSYFSPEMRQCRAALIRTVSSASLCASSSSPASISASASISTPPTSTPAVTKSEPTFSSSDKRPRWELWPYMGYFLLWNHQLVI